MKKYISLLFTLIFLVIFVTTCNETETVPPGDQNQEYGYLSLQVVLDIEAVSTTSRIKEVNTDNFIVTIHNAADGSEVMRFDPFSSAPAEIQLPTGEYFIRATNLEPPANAAFEQPWYFGESEIFNIDKEELKAIDVNCTLANCKVSFVYSQNVLDNFTDWNATTTLINEGDFLFWPKEETQEGYFITQPLQIEVYLEYTKVFTGELITRTFNTTIEDPQPATHYRVNIDASLQDGIIVLNINVDDRFDVIDIDLGDEGGSNEPETLFDADGNEYSTVQIGDQIWMGENLSVTQLNDGTPIPNLFGNDWANSTSPAYGIYNNAPSPTYGMLYNWYTVETGQLCPVGWHVPTDAEWTTLTDYLGGLTVAGGKLKESGTTHWTAPNTGATNETGFTGLPGGLRTTDGSYHFVGIYGLWWSSTEYNTGDALYRFLDYSNGGVVRNPNPMSYGYSVRCLKD